VTVPTPIPCRIPEIRGRRGNLPWIVGLSGKAERMPSEQHRRPRLSRRPVPEVGVGGAAVVVVVGATGLRAGFTWLLPGKQRLDELTGACSNQLAATQLFDTRSLALGTFYSEARGTTVGYTIAYPPGQGPGSSLL